MSASPEPGPVVTRFAPSPTGFLHIGGARTALFNWLYARHHGGEFLLRIEDTDRARSTQAAIDAILDGMKWLGLDWDGDAWFQSQFADRHAEVAQALLERGHAYKCWMSQDELAAQREAAQRERRPFRIRSPWRDADGDGEGDHVVRLKAPREGETVIADRVQGEVRVANEEIDDFILLRSDGSPTYMLAVVVDDHDMGITHVIRGDDHLNNAFRQLAIIRAMGWPEPVYGHVPLIHGADGAKLSKRHGALGVETYRDELGILPDALFNYLLRLGWGHGDDEIIGRDEAVRWFDLDHVGRSPSRFDTKKLENLNAHYLRQQSDMWLANYVILEIEKDRGSLQQQEIQRIHHLMGELKQRAKSLVDLVEASRFVVRDQPIPIKSAAKEVLDAGSEYLPHVRNVIASVEWSIEALEAAFRGLADTLGVKLGALAQPLRAALTGSRTSPGIFEVMIALGRDETIGRVEDAMNGRNPIVADD